MNKNTVYNGFTLIEMLVVVGLLAILFAITIVAINPFDHFSKTRNTQRSSDILSIMNAVTEYKSEDQQDIDTLIALTDFTGTLALCTGSPPSTVYTLIANDLVVGGANNDEDTYINLGNALVEEYIVEIPVDPNSSSITTDGSVETGYAICQTNGGRVQVIALETEVVGATTDELFVIR